MSKLVEFNPSWVSKLPDGRPGLGPSLDELKDYRLTADEASDIIRDQVRWAAVRYLCQTSLRFLVNCVLRPHSKKFLPWGEKGHGAIFNSFLQPDADRSFDEWSDVKERATLAFRGATKSTIVGGFLTQVILCDPDIRVLILSGKLAHAKTIKATACQPFYSNEVLGLLFPDNRVEEDDLGGDSFFAPTRHDDLNLRDATLTIGTFDSVKAGGHHELLLFDDCTNEINCATPELVEKNEQHYDDTEGLIEPGGYRHFFGTRWAPDDTDLPEVIRQRGETYAAEHNGEINTIYVKTPVWTLKDPNNPEVMERDRKNELSQEDVDLTWPEKLPWKYLFPKYRSNPVKFNGQYLLRWRGSLMSEVFTKELLLENTRPFAEGMPAPHDRFMVINWDMGGIYTGRRYKGGYDYSCGLAGMFELSTKRLFIYDAILEVFASSTDAAMAIVKFYQRQLRIGPVGACRIEDASGVRMLEGELIRLAKEQKVPLQIFWDPPDNTANSKNISIGISCGAMRKGLIQFNTVLPNREEIFRQYTNWVPRVNRSQRKDDGPDCVAQIWKSYSDHIYPKTIEMLKSSGNEWAPEPMVIEENVDPHADERENADFELLKSMTVLHA